MGNATFNELMALIQNAVTAGGTIWIVYGAVITGTALKDKNGPDLQRGVWQMVGGALITAAAVLLRNI